MFLIHLQKFGDIHQYKEPNNVPPFQLSSQVMRQRSACVSRYNSCTLHSGCQQSASRTKWGSCSRRRLPPNLTLQSSGICCWRHLQIQFSSNWGQLQISDVLDMGIFQGTEKGQAPAQSREKATHRLIQRGLLSSPARILQAVMKSQQASKPGRIRLNDVGGSPAGCQHGLRGSSA